MILYLDLETRSDIPLKLGVYKYAEGAHASVIVCAWAIDDGEVVVEDWLHNEPSVQFKARFYAADEIVAHNAQFDRIMLKVEGFDTDITRWRCTMAQAMSNSLPGSLDKLGAIMKVPMALQKHQGGKNLINLFCIPRKRDDGTFYFFDGTTHPTEWAEFLRYAGNDVEACRVLRKKLPRHNYCGVELATWHLDQKINDRGISVDVDLSRAAISASDAEQKRLRARTSSQSAGMLDSTTQRKELLEHCLGMYGVTLPDLQAGTLERRLEDPEIPEPVKDLLRIRLMASKTTASKYKTLVDAVCNDGRLHGLLQCFGALRTLRWAGRLFQPQNLMRTPKHLAKQMQFVIDCILDGVLDLFFENVMEALGAATRGALCAAPGKKLVVADLSNIEGRVLAWLAGEQWKIRAFGEFDEGTGHDLYVLAYAASFGVHPERVLEDEAAGGKTRLVGKVQELALGYQGAYGAFVSMGQAYGITVYDTPEPPVFARGVCISKKEVLGIVSAWRRANAAIVGFWGDVQEAAITAIQSPGVSKVSGRLQFRRDGPWLRIRLPSGRFLCYPHPEYGQQRVVCRGCGGMKQQVVGEDENGPVLEECPKCKGRGWNMDIVISYMGVDQYTRQWKRLHTYGGKLAENCLGANTEVLTPYGWWPIVYLRNDFLVWDGLEWVTHSGVAAQGPRNTMQLHGVGITPEHLVWVDKQWEHAGAVDKEKAAPSFDRYLGQDLRGAYGFVSRGKRWAKKLLEYRLRLRKSVRDGGDRIQQRTTKIVRLFAFSGDLKSKHNTRYVDLARLRSLALDASEVREPPPRCISALRGTWVKGVRPLAKRLCSFLAGYGQGISQRAHSGTLEQLKGVFTGQLRVGFSESASTQYSGEQASRDARGADALGRSCGIERYKRDDTRVSRSERLAYSEVVRPTLLLEQTYDILDCGPRHRFVVRAGKGYPPFLVHNCTQAASRDVLRDGMLDAEAEGYAVCLSVHDELITETPDTDDWSAEGLAAIMTRPRAWYAGLPLAAKGYEAMRYRK